MWALHTPDLADPALGFGRALKARMADDFRVRAQPSEGFLRRGHRTKDQMAVGWA